MRKQRQHPNKGHREDQKCKRSRWWMRGSWFVHTWLRLEPHPPFLSSPQQRPSGKAFHAQPLVSASLCLGFLYPVPDTASLAASPTRKVTFSHLQPSLKDGLWQVLLSGFVSCFWLWGLLFCFWLVLGGLFCFILVPGVELRIFSGGCSAAELSYLWLKCLFLFMLVFPWISVSWH